MRSQRKARFPIRRLLLIGAALGALSALVPHPVRHAQASSVGYGDDLVGANVRRQAAEAPAPAVDAAAQPAAPAASSQNHGTPSPSASAAPDGGAAPSAPPPSYRGGGCSEMSPGYL